MGWRGFLFLVLTLHFVLNSVTVESVEKSGLEDLFFDDEHPSLNHQSNLRNKRSNEDNVEASGDSPDDDEDGLETTTLLPTTKSGSGHSRPHPYVTVEVCGKQVHCKRGLRGPCLPNEILAEESKFQWSPNSKAISCSGVNHPGCYHGRQVSHLVQDAPPGRCVLRFPTRPCYGYPRNYRYNPLTQTCNPPVHSRKHGRPSRIPSRNRHRHCTNGQSLFKYSHRTKKCRCLNSNQLIYSMNNRCYRPYVQGPCTKGHWLEPYHRNKLRCRPCPCYQGQADGFHYYWKGSNYGRSGCYRVNTRGPCRSGQYFVVDRYFHTRCVQHYIERS